MVSSGQTSVLSSEVNQISFPIVHATCLTHTSYMLHFERRECCSERICCKSSIKNVIGCWYSVLIFYIIELATSKLPPGLMNCINNATTTLSPRRGMTSLSEYNVTFNDILFSVTLVKVRKFDSGIAWKIYYPEKIPSSELPLQSQNLFSNQ